jgi:hypothetical protein
MLSLCLNVVPLLTSPSQKHEAPVSIRVVNSAPGKFIFAEHYALADTLNGHTVIAVLAFQPRRDWVLQNTDVPIPVTPNTRILAHLRGLTDKDCSQLKDELAYLPILGKRNRTESAPSVPGANTQLPIMPPPSTSLPALSNPATFPLVYVCDMLPGMTALAALPTLSSFGTITPVFEQHFPGLPVVRKTILKHRLVFRRATSLGIVDEFRRHGHTDAGKWSALVNAVYKITNSEFPLENVQHCGNTDAMANRSG